MHELHLAQDILKKIEAEAGSRGMTKVALARVKVGEARVSDPPELKEILADIAKGTMAEGMRFELEIVPLKGRCASCQSEFAATTPRLDCPACGSTDIEISSGKELLVADLK